MGYVKILLKGKLLKHQELLEGHLLIGHDDAARANLKVINEIEYVLGILEHNNTYQKY